MNKLTIEKKTLMHSYLVLKDLGRYLLMILLTSQLIVAQTDEKSKEINGNLVSVRWLEKNINNENITIIDASPAQIYKTKHIAGAVSDDIFSYGPKEMPFGEIEKRYQSWGISLGKKIVIYDQGGTFLATRLFFSLYYYGFPVKDLFILDGGLTKWVEAGFSTTEEATPAPLKGTFTIKKLNEDAAAQLPEFLTASGDIKKNVLLEALDPNWHYGGNTFFDKPGHIPNAIMTPSSDYFNPDKTFKSQEEIRNMMTYLGIKNDQTIYSHCGGGIAASVPFFALKFILDYTNVKLFRGSQLEWISDQRDLPMWTYDAPFLLRDAQWLKFWGGKTARMYGISNITMLDVRSEEEFKDGHLPFAINIPAGKFETNLSQSAKLAEILGVAGIGATEEVVIVSGKGLTKETALVFIALQKLGQKKLSVFLDKSENWTQLGFTLIKDSISQRDQKTTSNLIVPANSFPLNIQTNIIINDPLETQGIYPKVFIVSGKNVPSGTSDYNLVTLPYSDLLKIDGSPKDAIDIWTYIDKTGIPRYAELICISDDPGEAAVNYFILKLMGYPDVKVWLN